MAEQHEKTHRMIREVFRYSQGYCGIPWGSSARYKRDLFPVLFAKCGFTKGAEIGVRRGAFTKQMCEANQQLHMLCVDPWAAYGRYTQRRQDGIFAECLKNLANCNVTIIRKTSMEAVGEVPVDSLDFAYIDGHHGFDYVCEDIIHWSRRVRSGGIVALHDYHHGRGVDVVEAVNAYTRAHHIDPWYVTKESQPTAYWVKP